MKISTRGQYAIVVMTDLAKHQGKELVTAKNIADRNDISIKYLEQILNTLNKCGYIHAVRGKNGGYMLKKAPSEYKVGDILRALEGSLEPINGLDYELETPSNSSNIKNMSLWKGLYDAINEYVDRITVEMLINNGDGH